MSPGEAPLAGRGVLVTRPAGHADPLATGLELLGARVHCVPAIEIRPRADDLCRAAAAARSADWLVFTSASATRLFLEKGDGPLPRAPRIACIGPATAAPVRAAGLTVDLMPPPEAYRAEGLLAALLARGVAGATVVIPTALVTRDVLAEGLSAAGAMVQKIPIYETVSSTDGAARLRYLLATNAIDVVTFTSSSTVDAFHELAPEPPAGLLYAAIGPVTAETARARGYAPLLTASTSTVSGLLDTLAAHYRKRPC